MILFDSYLLAIKYLRLKKQSSIILLSLVRVFLVIELCLYLNEFITLG